SLSRVAKNPEDAGWRLGGLHSSMSWIASAPRVIATSRRDSPRSLVLREGENMVAASVGFGKRRRLVGASQGVAALLRDPSRLLDHLAGQRRQGFNAGALGDQGRNVMVGQELR